MFVYMDPIRFELLKWLVCRCTMPGRQLGLDLAATHACVPHFLVNEYCEMNKSSQTMTSWLHFATQPLFGPSLERLR